MKPATTSQYRSQFMLVGAVILLFTLYMYLPASGGPGIRGGGVEKPFKIAIPARMDFLIVSDLDKRSAIEGLKKPRWKAVLKRGALLHDASKNTFSVEWGTSVDLTSGHGEEGRGMELSELILWNNRLYTMDDRSGIVYEVVDYRTPSARVVPRYILMEGNGETEKGFKGEWGTVKDGNLIIASFGKEYANNDGTIKNLNNNWIAEITPEGKITYKDWTPVYNAMRKESGHEFPSYILHEAAVWSELHHQWFFLPRRMSKAPYDEAKDEKMGANTIFVLSESGEFVNKVTVGNITPERGFSTAKFVPGSGDSVFLALKSAEFGETDTQATYICVVTTDGRELMVEETVPGAMKFEGLEFI